MRNEVRVFWWGEGGWWGWAVRGHCLHLDHCSDIHWTIEIPAQNKYGFPCCPLPKAPLNPLPTKPLPAS